MAVGVGVGVGVGVVSALVVAWHALIFYEVDIKCEKPKHQVVRTLGERKDWLRRSRPLVEVRRYAPYLLAEVVIEGGDMRGALSSGFRQIAGFIFGNNTVPGIDASAAVAMTSPVTLEMASGGGASQKIAMTSPVAAEIVGGESGEGKTFKVSFIMPSKYTAATLPRPNNPNVQVREMPARTMAALAWYGASPREEAVAERAAALREALREAGLRPTGAEDVGGGGGKVNLWQFYPPFAPFWMRRNEVLLELDEDEPAATS